MALDQGGRKSIRKRHVSATLELEELRARLLEAEETLYGISNGEVDALVISGGEGKQIYTLRGADYQYRTLIEEMNEGAVIIDKLGTITYCNKRFAAMLKAPLEKVIGSSFFLFVPASRKERFSRMLEHGSGSSRSEFMLIAVSGDQVPVYLAFSAMQVDGLSGTCMVATDLTEQKRNEAILAEKREVAEALLRGQTDLYQTLLQAQSDIGLGMLLLDADRYTFVNDAYCALTGYSREELLAFPSVSVLSPPDRSDAYTGNSREIRGGKRVEGHMETTIISKSGQYIEVDAFAKVLELEGRIVTMVIVRDITERKQAEVALEKIANRLEQSNQELERFAFAASHDLQEPLRKIQAFASRLRDKYAQLLGKDALESLDYILDAASRLEIMIKGVLALSRVASRGQPFERVNLGEVAREVLADLELRIEKTGAHVELGDLPTIDADPAQMRQLLQNLIGNALKFHLADAAPLIKVQSEGLWPESSARSRTSSQLTTSNLMIKDVELRHAPAYRVTVEDNGVGFDERFLDRIFMPFQRLHTSSEYEGTGMGLAICRKIVERHDGTMTATSAPGSGAKFIVTLPSPSALEGRANGI